MTIHISKDECGGTTIVTPTSDANTITLGELLVAQPAADARLYITVDGLLYPVMALVRVDADGTIVKLASDDLDKLIAALAVRALNPSDDSGPPSPRAG